MAKRNRVRNMYLVLYRRNGRGRWYETIPTFSKQAADRMKLFYEQLYGVDNAMMEVMDKNGRPIRRYDDEEEYQPEPRGRNYRE